VQLSRSKEFELLQNFTKTYVLRSFLDCSLLQNRGPALLDLPSQQNLDTFSAFKHFIAILLTLLLRPLALQVTYFAPVYCKQLIQPVREAAVLRFLSTKVSTFSIIQQF
jgi:hypothetical protein